MGAKNKTKTKKNMILKMVWSRLGSLWAMGEGGCGNKRRSWSTWGAGDHGDDGIGDDDISNDGVFLKFSN